jgi:hypothetical protein
MEPLIHSRVYDLGTEKGREDFLRDHGLKNLAELYDWLRSKDLLGDVSKATH